ncbi:hypothetical protein KSS87_007413, partial [Heliosperma pusillum]
MASMRLCGVLVVIFLTIFVVTFSDATVFKPIRHYVNGKQGWVPSPSQSYNQWAGSHRFLVNDTLYFSYNKEEDSVLEVNEQDYNTCNTNNPIMKEQNGESEISLTHSGPYYFISGNTTRCDHGEKMIVKVLSYHPPPTPSPPTPPPSYMPPPPASSPSGVVPLPKSPSSAPGPKTSPIIGQPPIAGGPSSPGTPGTSAPATSPSSSTPAIPGPTMSPSSGTPGMSAPATSPSSGSTPAITTAPAMSPTSGTPAMSAPATSPTPMT